MGYSKIYRTLFSVEILHHYFLDEGEDIYDAGLDTDKMEANLAIYDLKSFMDIIPTKKTQTILRNFRSRFVLSKQGFQVAMAADGNEPFIAFSSDLKFDFVVRITDPYFENYTDISIDRSEPLFLSNVTPADAIEPEEGEEKTAIPVRFCLLSKFTTDLTNGSPDPTLPMERKEVELPDVESRELIGAFAVISIHLTGEVGEITLSNGGTEFNETLPEVNLRFKNRSTVWKYHRSKDSVQVHTTAGEKPLTKNGYIPVNDGSTDYPNPSASMIYNGEDQVYKDLNDAPVAEDSTKKYSRIFI